MDKVVNEGRHEGVAGAIHRPRADIVRPNADIAFR